MAKSNVVPMKVPSDCTALQQIRDHVNSVKCALTCATFALDSVTDFEKSEEGQRALKVIFDSIYALGHVEDEIDGMGGSHG